MKLSFMTFLYPRLRHDAVIAKALQFGYQGIEWRAEAEHLHGIELESSAEEIRGHPPGRRGGGAGDLLPRHQHQVL